jgi:SET domain-containing protein
MPEDRELVRITVVLPSPGKGKGLFARVDIPKDTIVARMRDCARMKRTEVDEYMAEHPNLPFDFVIYRARSSLVFYDTSWDGTGRVPLWYRLNHSSRPNCAPTILNPDASPREQEMGWVSTKNIRSGDELTFCYEDVPDEWV